MPDKVFFSSSFIGRQISFDNEQPSEWVLAEKLSEEVHQEDKCNARIYGPCSISLGVFSCKDVDSDELMTMKIMMQIPYTGSEFEPAQERQKQATSIFPLNASDEFEARKKLAANGCTSAPVLHNYKVDQQDDSSFAPGGYIIYMLIEPVPGVCLGYVDDCSMKSVYWDSPPVVQEGIREAFRLAQEWEYDAPYRLWSQHILERVYWDAATKKVYVDSFESPDDAGKYNTKERELLYKVWGLER